MWKRTSFSWATAVWVLLVRLAVPAIVWACPNCNEAVTGDPVAAAFNVTTIALIALPFLLVGSIGSWVTYVYWRAGRHAAATAEPAAGAWQPIWTEEESRT